MSRVILALASLAAVLVAVLALELLAMPDPVAGPPEATPAPPALPVAASNTPAEARDKLDVLVQTVLARPLFTPGRRPAPAAEGPAGAADADLPRLAGVIVAPSGRRAIFVSADAHSLVVQEGGSVGRYVVRSIAPGQVTLVDAERQQVIRPSHAKGTMP